MSQEKAQLIAPIGIMTVSGVTATGVITATSFSGNIVGSAKSLVNGADVTVGVMTATSLDGNLTGNIQRLADSAPNISAGVSTATSFVGNLTGSVTDLTSAPAITVGLVTASGLEGNITGNVVGNVVGNVTGNVTGTISGDVTGNVTGNATGIADGLAGGLGVNYNGGWTGAGTSQITAGVITATTFYGDGSTLDGVSSGPVSQQSIGITSATTSIDLSLGNIVYATQSSNTAVSFANTSNGNVYFIRAKDSNDTARTITWPDRIKWDGGSAPTLISESISGDAQVFLLVTSDMGVTYYAKEVVNYDLDVPFHWYRWGLSDNGNQAGLLGQNSNIIYSSPVQIPGTWTGVAGRLAAKQDGTLWALGQDGQGQAGRNVGDGSNDGMISSPTQVGTDSSWATASSKIMGAPRVSLAIKKDGTLWTWGYGDQGNLANNKSGATAQRSSPTQVGTDTTWNYVNATKSNGGTAIQHGIKTDGTLWVWGTSYYGQLGLGPSPTSYSSPVQLPGAWSMTSCGMDHVGGVKTNGTLWTWGNGDFGKTGHNNVGTTYSSPKQLPGTDWSVFSAGTYCSVAVKTNGTLWAWGYNSNGQLGVNNTTQYSSPKQVGTDTTWLTASVSNVVVNALKTDGSMWVWGLGEQGAMGNNTSGPTANRSSPIQVGTSVNWLNRMKKGMGNTGQSRFSEGGLSI